MQESIRLAGRTVAAAVRPSASRSSFWEDAPQRTTCLSLFFTRFYFLLVHSNCGLDRTAGVFSLTGSPASIPRNYSEFFSDPLLRR